jgi:hypothetical protein
MGATAIDDQNRSEFQPQLRGNTDAPVIGSEPQLSCSAVATESWTLGEVADAFSAAERYGR